MIKKYLKKVRFDYKISCLNRILDILTDKGKKELLQPDLVKVQPFKNVLVLSPHPDDDVLGCGGSIIKHKEAGNKVSVICFTDGCRGNLESEKVESLASLRKDEMKKAHQLLGIDKAFYLDYEDGFLSANTETVEKTSEIIREISPEAIYLPFFIDYHKDHVETTRILLNGLKDNGFNGKCVAYEVNSPIYPNTIVDITDCIDRKLDALNCYRTQLSVNNYVHTIIEGLNRFRTNSVMLGKGYAEGFYVCDIGFYKQLAEVYFSKSYITK